MIFRLVHAISVLIYLSRLRIPRLECVGFGEWLGAKAQD